MLGNVVDIKRSDFLLYNVNSVRKLFNAKFLKQYLLGKKYEKLFIQWLVTLS